MGMMLSKFTILYKTWVHTKEDTFPTVERFLKYLERTNQRYIIEETFTDIFEYYAQTNQLQAILFLDTYRDLTDKYFDKPLTTRYDKIVKHLKKLPLMLIKGGKLNV